MTLQVSQIKTEGRHPFSTTRSMRPEPRGPIPWSAARCRSLVVNGNAMPGARLCSTLRFVCMYTAHVFSPRSLMHLFPNQHRPHV